MRARIYRKVSAGIACLGMVSALALASPAQAADRLIKISGDGPLEGATLTTATNVYLEMSSPGQLEFVRWVLKNPYGRTIDKARDDTVPFTYRIADRKDGHYTLSADLAMVGDDLPRVRAGFWFGPPTPPHRTDDERHHGVNCNTISNPGGSDHRVCMMVNSHDTWLWRQALADLCAGSKRGADYFWLDRIWLERNGQTVESNSNRQWVPICGSGLRDSYSTDWDHFCSPGPQPHWQGHVRFALHWRSGGQTNLKEIHSGVDSGLC